MQNNQRGFWPLAIIVILIIAAGIAIYYATTGPSQAPVTTATSTTATTSTQNIQATFSCGGGKSINAMFMNATTATTTGNSVMLALSDGRQMTLPQVVSADGARYANTNQSVVFWNVGNTATITENGTTTYSDCSTKNNQ